MGVLLALGAALSVPAGLRAANGRPPVGQFMRVDVARKAITLTLIAADGAGNNGFNFDDYGRGEMLVSVPAGWRVSVDCRNRSAYFSSCVVVAGPGASAPAFPGATTPRPLAGIAPGASASFAFVASRTGSYRLASLVAGDEDARMWDVLEVSRGGRPSISVRPGP